MKRRQYSHIKSGKLRCIATGTKERLPQLSDVRGATIEQAMLSARTAILRSHPKLNTWAAYQVYGDPDYRFPLPSA